MKKVVKAKDCYGPVLERVKQNNIAKVQQENDTADPPPPGGNVPRCPQDWRKNRNCYSYIYCIIFNMTFR